MKMSSNLGGPDLILCLASLLPLLLTIFKKFGNPNLGIRSLRNIVPFQMCAGFLCVAVWVLSIGIPSGDTSNQRLSKDHKMSSQGAAIIVIFGFLHFDRGYL